MESRSHNFGFSPISYIRCAIGYKISSSASMATLGHTQWWFIRPKSVDDHQGVVWNQSFPLLEHTPVTGRASCLAATIPGSWSAAVCELFAANLYMCIHVHTHVHIHAYTYTYAHVCAHLYTSTYHPAIRHLQTRHTVGASYLLRH